jgi:hypothetical protein
MLVSLATSCTLIGVEFLNRTSDSGLLNTLLRTAPLIALAQVGLYYVFNWAPSWQLGWVIFSLTNAILRAAAAHFLAHEPIGWGGFVGISLMVLGALAIHKG